MNDPLIARAAWAMIDVLKTHAEWALFDQSDNPSHFSIDGVVDFYGLARAALDAAAAWQPIETAPRDGTWILAWPCYSGSMPVCMVRWEGKRPACWKRPMGYAIPLKPTHWLPLPAPPSP